MPTGLYQNNEFKQIGMLLLCVKQATKAQYIDDKAIAPIGDKNPVVGEYYNAIGDLILDDGLYYFLERFGVDECFHESLFALPSDLDETTLVNEEWEEKVCEPVNK